MARKTRQVETRMVSEYLLTNYSKFPYTMNVPLGALPSELLAKEGYQRAIGMMRPFRPAVDGVVVLPRHLLLVEAKVWNIVNGLAKLPLYKSLALLTPELAQYMPREVLMQLVVGWTNPNLEVMAREANVEVILFCPDWLQEVVTDMHNYWTPAYQEQREKKLRMREYFGVE
jgi:hypothetical protein